MPHFSNRQANTFLILLTLVLALLSAPAKAGAPAAQKNANDHSGPLEPMAVANRGGSGFYHVGPHPDCHYATIGEAIDATQGLGSNWANVAIRLSGPVSHYLGQTYSISLDDFSNVTEVSIVGGYQDCSGSPSGNTVLDADGSGRVFNISNSSTYDGDSRIINLRNLNIQGASHNLSFGGGGVLVNGTPGRLSVNLINTTVRENFAGTSGGGIKLRAIAARNGTAAMLTADNNSVVTGNSTNGNGGGVACESLVGGLGSSTLIRWGAGPIANNQAENGGAISIEGGCSRTFFYNGAFLAGILGNQASDAGGAVYVAGDDSYISLRGDQFDGFGNPDWRVDIVNNEATRGGAIYARDASEVFLSDANLANNLAETGGGAIYANAGDTVVTVGRITAFQPCQSGTFGRCSSVRNNTVTDGTGGAFLARNDATINVSRTFVEGNSASGWGSIAAVSGAGPGTINLESILATGNQDASALLFALHGQIDLRWSTVTDNPGFSYAAYAVANSASQPASIRLISSILWEASGSMAIEVNDDSTIDIDCVIGWQPAGNLDVSGINFYQSSNPMFVDPSGGDYRPGPVSPAIDYCDGFHTPEYADIDGNERGMQHQGSPTQPNPDIGPFDLGAYETSWEPLIDELFDDRFESN